MSAETTAPGGFRVALAVAILLAGIAVPALAAPGLNRTPPSASGTALVSAAGLARYALSDAQLSRIRGGFALPNGINLNFGFQQITTINGTIVQGILVPELSHLEGRIPIYVIGGSVRIDAGDAIPDSVLTGLSAQGVKVSRGSARTTSDAFNSAVSAQATTVSYSQSTGVTKSGGSGLTTNVANTQSTATAANPSAAGKEYSVPTSSAVTVSTGVTDPAGNLAAAIQTTLGPNGVFSSINNTLSNELIQQATQTNISVSGLAASVSAAQALSRVVNSVTQAVKIP